MSARKNENLLLLIMRQPWYVSYFSVETMGWSNQSNATECGGEQSAKQIKKSSDCGIRKVGPKVILAPVLDKKFGVTRGWDLGSVSTDTLLLSSGLVL